MEASGQAGGRQAVHTCGPFTLRTSHGLSPPQWATAAKQAKCRQTFDSAWVPHIRPPGVVGGGWLGWGPGLGSGQPSLLQTAFLELLRCGDSEPSPTQRGSPLQGRVGG